MPIASRGKGYPIPDEPEPDGYHCVRFYVPKDSLYLGAFWQSLHFLASPRAWADDSDHTALIVADVWKAAIHKSQEMDTCAEGDCGIMDVRQKPDDPCVLQKLPDCSSEWVDFATLTDCSQEVPDGTQETSEDETLDALWATKATIETIHYLLISNTPTQVKYIMSSLGIAGMNETIDAMAGVDEGDRQDAIDDMDWEAPFTFIYCDRTECLLGNFTQPFSQDWVACFLNNLENWCAGAAGDIADWAAALINDVIPASFMNMVNMFPGGGQDFGFSSPDCGLYMEWDFSGGSQQGWNAYLTGEWRGNGWGDTWPPGYDGVMIYSPEMDEMTITKVYIFMDRLNTGTNPIGQTSRYPDQSQYVYVSGDGSPGSMYEIECAMDIAQDGRFIAQIDAYAGGDQDCLALITRVAIIYEEP